MPVEDDHSIESRVVRILRNYSGRKSILREHMIGGDLGIYGGDGVQILYDLEDELNVDLERLMTASTTYLRVSCLGKLLGKKTGPPNADCAVGQLVDYIESGGEKL